ncbi:hypothetical protein NBRC116494_02030 [Aurantivibrio plasticivorans]
MPRVEASDIAFIQYTSGSTSKPKGVVITHENIMANSEEIRREFDNKPGDVGVTWLPFFHDMGLIGHIIQPLYTGMLNYFLSPIRFVAQPYLWLEAISKYDGAVSGGPNFGYQLCCEKVNDEQIERLDLSGWKLAYSGSEKINPVTMKDFSRRFVDCGYKSSIFYPCYGLAESTLFVAGTKGAIKTSGLGESEYVAVGKVSKNIKLVSPETNQIIRDGDVGEIYVKSKSIAREYYLNSLASRAIFDQTVAGDRGYVKTGDLGFIKDSNLYFVGRIKNIIKQNGKNFYLEDIESIVHELTRPMLVNRCAAVGLTFDREELVILIELKMKHFSQEAYNLIEIDVSNELRTRIGIVPYAIKIVAPHSIPLTTSGKIKRDKCQELCSKIINTVDGCITWESKVLDTETLS